MHCTVSIGIPLVVTIHDSVVKNERVICFQSKLANKVDSSAFSHLSTTKIFGKQFSLNLIHF